MSNTTNEQAPGRKPLPMPLSILIGMIGVGAIASGISQMRAGVAEIRSATEPAPESAPAESAEPALEVAPRAGEAAPTATPGAAREGTDAADAERRMQEAAHLLIDGDPEAAFRRVSTGSVPAGEPHLDYLLGLIHQHGLGRARDPELARAHLGAAADAFCPQAMSALAQLLFESEPRACFEWLHRAALLGDVRAQGRLAGMYYQGDPIAADPVRAYAWAIVAAENGHEKVKGNLAAMGAVVPEERRQDVQPTVDALKATMARVAEDFSALPIELDLAAILGPPPTAAASPQEATAGEPLVALGPSRAAAADATNAAFRDALRGDDRGAGAPRTRPASRAASRDPLAGSWSGTALDSYDDGSELRWPCTLTLSREPGDACRAELHGELSAEDDAGRPLTIRYAGTFRGRVDGASLRLRSESIDVRVLELDEPIPTAPQELQLDLDGERLAGFIGNDAEGWTRLTLGR